MSQNMITTAVHSPWPGGSGRQQAMAFSGTIRDRVAFVLRQEILGGELLKGQRLGLDELAARYGTSRTPIREACLELSHEGLVEVAPRSGVTVIGATARDIGDNFVLMATLGGLAAQMAAERMTDQQMARIAQLEQELSATAEGDPALVYRNWQFHRSVNQACESPRLLHLLRICGRMVPDALTMAPEQISCGRREHAQLVEALTARDGSRARQVAEEHFLNAGRLWSDKYAALLRKDA